MRVDNKIYWNLFQNLFTETAQCYQRCGQQTKNNDRITECFTEESSSRLWSKKSSLDSTSKLSIELVIYLELLLCWEDMNILTPESGIWKFPYLLS